MAKRPFATALVRTTEPVTAGDLRREVLAAIYRVAHQLTEGLPRTFASMMMQEGRAGVFAGMRTVLGQQDLAAARAVIQAEPADAAYLRAFACLYGDEAAQTLGYPALGLPARAGFDVALADAIAAGTDPVAALVAVDIVQHGIRSSGRVDAPEPRPSAAEAPKAYVRRAAR